MKTIAIAAGAGLVAAVAAGVMFLRPEPMIASCEEAVVERLKVPSSYDLLEARYEIDEVTAEEASGELMYPNDPDFVRLHQAKLEIYAKGAWRHRVHLKYEAQNALGVPLRLRETCTYYTDQPEVERAVPRAYIDLGVD